LYPEPRNLRGLGEDVAPIGQAHRTRTPSKPASVDQGWLTIQQGREDHGRTNGRPNGHDGPGTLDRADSAKTFIERLVATFVVHIGPPWRAIPGTRNLERLLVGRGWARTHNLVGADMAKSGKIRVGGAVEAHPAITLGRIGGPG